MESRLAWAWVGWTDYSVEWSGWGLRVFHLHRLLLSWPCDWERTGLYEGFLSYFIFLLVSVAVSRLAGFFDSQAGIHEAKRKFRELTLYHSSGPGSLVGCLLSIFQSRLMFILYGMSGFLILLAGGIEKCMFIFSEVETLHWKFFFWFIYLKGLPHPVAFALLIREHFCFGKLPPAPVELWAWRGQTHL